ncbi:tRNA (guanosine(37)-N1)-methyltransferase TrmD [Adlercreutzia sp. ZJ141]|uniref:tRNA (guanosine(37)-N1)-methyltransferase TrmD n=1 Tax=Adlercreutzia sp. ZJ141 TaxID=2709406 RepID=UPI0013E9C509|nr:tRNA (guanosine(37)-N1)-methyltransferase TrmD [Adlercreutzia sp. ZJ141]
MIIETLSTFPGMYESVMGSSMMRIAQEKGIIDFFAHDLRDWTHDKHRTTDDEPYGGGAGLVMKCEPIFEAVDDIAGNSTLVTPLLGQRNALSLRQSCSYKSAAGAFDSCGTRLVSTPSPEERGDVNAPKPTIIFLAPQGQRFDDALACELAREERLLFVCGHYEGIDERAYALADRVISLGDYVLTSGELASMVIIDAVVRKLPGVLGAQGGAETESFADGLLEYPQYTRPAVFRGMEVPPVLLSGDHGKVDRWRREQSLERTARMRPDLLEGMSLPNADLEFLQSLSIGERCASDALS